MIVKQAFTATTNTNGNATNGPYINEVEIKIKKEDAINLFNNYSCANVSGGLDAMWFYTSLTTYRLKDTAKNDLTFSSKHFAKDISNYTEAELIEFFGDYGRLPTSNITYVPSLIVFGGDIKAMKNPNSAVVNEQPCTNKDGHNFKSYPANAATLTIPSVPSIPLSL